MLGPSLKKLRTQKGLSQDDMAEKLHVVRQTISKWENELSSPNVEQLVRLSALLEVSTDMLLRTNTELVRTPKDEMITAITKRLEGLNETGVKTLYDFLMIFPDKERWLASTSPERIAELDAISAQREQEERLAKEREEERARREEENARREKEAKREQYYRDHAGMFKAIKTVHMPTCYDLTLEEIRAIDFLCGEISRCFPEYAFDVSCNYFKYGFVKGVRYAKAQAKRKNSKTGK